MPYRLCALNMDGEIQASTTKKALSFQDMPGQPFTFGPLDFKASFTMLPGIVQYYGLGQLEFPTLFQPQLSITAVYQPASNI